MFISIKKWTYIHPTPLTHRHFLAYVHQNFVLPPFKEDEKFTLCSSFDHSQVKHARLTSRSVLRLPVEMAQRARTLQEVTAAAANQVSLDATVRPTLMTARPVSSSCLSPFSFLFK